jgi:hypothetical protein
MRIPATVYVDCDYDGLDRLSLFCFLIQPLTLTRKPLSPICLLQP